MGSLSNLYISSSFQSLLHFGNNNTASVNLTEIEDGFGNGLGISLNTAGDLDVERQLVVHYGAEITGAVDINTTFSGSTQLFVNQSSVNTQIRITGSYTPAGNQASITEIGIGWLVNGGAVSNGRVIGITGTPNSDVTYTINQPYTANNVSYSFTGSIQREVEIEGDLNVSNNLFVGGHLIVEDSVEITGSIDITGNVTASNALIENDLTVVGTINAYKLNVTIESSSVIFSSGSNILGDSTSDTQTLNGSIIMSGSSSLTGSMGITGDLNILGNISSSTLSGGGNVTLYSASVNSRLTNLQLYTASAETKFSAIQTYTSSMNVYTASVNAKILSLEQFTASVGLVTTQSFQEYTASNNQKWSTLQNVTSSILAFTSSQETKNITLANYTGSNDTKWSTLQTYTSSINADLTSIHQTTASLNTFTASQNNSNATFATTGSNTFVGSNVFNKSVNGIVNALSITSNTASMDCLLGNFFTLTLVANTPTRLIPTNIQAGETISLKLTQPATTGSLTYNSSTIKFPAGLQYTASALANSIDILTFVTYDASTLFSVAVKNMS